MTNAPYRRGPDDPGAHRARLTPEQRQRRGELMRYHQKRREIEIANSYRIVDVRPFGPMRVFGGIEVYFVPRRRDKKIASRDPSKFAAQWNEPNGINWAALDLAVRAASRRQNARCALAQRNAPR